MKVKKRIKKLEDAINEVMDDQDLEITERLTILKKVEGYFKLRLEDLEADLMSERDAWNDKYGI